jgi:hypothetical protein
MQDAGVKAIITGLPGDALSEWAARQWNRTGTQFGIEFIETGSLEVARELAEKYAF